MATTQSASAPARPEDPLADALNDAPLSRFHRRVVFTAGLGFFTDAYDLTVIGTVLILLKEEFHPSTREITLVASTALIATALGAVVFGRIADKIGRKSIYGLEAATMAVGALASAFVPSIGWLIVVRFILGLGVGGDYPASAVITSEFANKSDRGRLVALTYASYTLGAVAAPAVALALLSTGMSHSIVWRLLLGLGALPALVVLYMRRTMPESPRYTAQVRGDQSSANATITLFTQGQVAPVASVDAKHGGPTPTTTIRWGAVLTLLLGTGGTWMLYNYFFYGNNISVQLLLKQLAPGASLVQLTALQLGLLAVFSLPAVGIGILIIDRVGHRTLQIFGLALAAAAFATLGFIPGLLTNIALFLPIYGLTVAAGVFIGITTFVLPAEVFPAHLRATGHGISAGLGKTGAFIGAGTVPAIVTAHGLDTVLLIGCACAIVAIGLTALCLPQVRGQSLEDLARLTTK